MEDSSGGISCWLASAQRMTVRRRNAMSIKRDDIDKRKVDFTDIASGRRLPPVHPGEILRDEFLTPMKISVYELANAIKVSRTRANDIVLGRRAITIDTAIRLGRYFGTSSEFWINLQTRYDLDVADRTVRRRIEQEISPRAA
jgi:antitoxin HigA-1